MLKSKEFSFANWWYIWDEIRLFEANWAPAQWKLRDPCRIVVHGVLCALVGFCSLNLCLNDVERQVLTLGHFCSRESTCWEHLMVVCGSTANFWDSSKTHAHRWYECLQKINRRKIEHISYLCDKTNKHSLIKIYWNVCRREKKKWEKRTETQQHKQRKWAKDMKKINDKNETNNKNENRKNVKKNTQIQKSKRLIKTESLTDGSPIETFNNYHKNW